ncbi:MAG TPA: hypothetical protein VHW44_23650 [Pseudonocardiaceae bacterium]|jgi:hypothetical protein|nr:hypothetical protein [Pseudonocardiaceae bacterium]
MTGRPEADANRVLACGRSPVELAALVTGGTDADPDLAAHAESCPYCQAELAEQQRLWQAVRRAAQAPVPTPPELVTRVLAAVHGVRGRSGGTPIELDQPGGRLLVGEPAVVLLARRLVTDFADQRGDLHVREVAMVDAGLQVLVSVRYRTEIGAAMAALREHLHAGLALHLGDAVPAVDLHVVDVIPPS